MQLSRPFQIALAAMAVFALVWFFALNRHSSSSGSSEATPAATPSAPAASAAQKAATPAPSAPGVEGLTKAIAKAHGAVSQSEQNAKQLREKSAQASSSAAPAPSSSTPSSPPAATKSSAATGSQPSSTAAKSPSAAPHHPASGAASSSAPGPNRIPDRQVLVETALRQGKVALVLFWNPKGTDDVAVHRELRLLEELHHLIQPLAGSPVLRRALKRSGLELDWKIAVLEASADQVALFGTFTRNVQIYGTPTLLVINKRGQTKTITGLTDAYSIEQAVDEARQA